MAEKMGCEYACSNQKKKEIKRQITAMDFNKRAARSAMVIYDRPSD